MTDQSSHSPEQTSFARRLLAGLTAAALLLGGLRRLLLEHDQPLWFDELFSAAIATRPDLHSLIARCLRELSGPVYYGLLWLWVRIGGVSDLALRAPSIACAIAGPLVILRWGHPDRRVRWLWAGIAALWLPASHYAGQARPYSLLILLAIVQTIALARHLRRPSLALAMLWAGTSALMILTHYHAIILTGLQALLIVARGRAAIRWPALLPFVAVAAWMGFHLPILLAFARPGVAWYPPFGLAKLPEVFETTFGAALFGVELAVLVALTTLASFATPRLRSVRAGFERSDVATALSGLCAVAVVLGLATIRPSFSARYLLPFMPSVLFGIALWATAWSRRIPLFGAAILLLFLLLAGRDIARQWQGGDVNPLTFNAASRYLAGAHPARLLFLWDSPSAVPAGVPLYDDVAGFELHRAGVPTAVTTLILPAATDPNAGLLAAADRPGDAILWSYDHDVHDTLAIRYPPAIAQRDPRWRCHDFGRPPVTVYACIRGVAAPAGAGG